MKTKLNKIVLAVSLIKICFVLNAQQTVTDIDGNEYQTVTIGSQKWMKENLKTIRYSNGDSIANIIDAAEWINLDSGAYSNYNNDSNNVAVHGRLYNGFTVIDNRNLCPAGWHVPTDSDWITLTTFLGGENLSGGKLKEVGTTHWNSPNTGATNTSGFTALASGGRMYTDGSFQYIGQFGGWWSSTEQDDPIHIKYRNISNNENTVGNYSSPKQFGFSVRCIEDPIPDSAKYFGQTPPGDTAIMFAPGIVSIEGRFESKIVYSPDSKELYISIPSYDRGMILYTKYANNQWTNQEEASFSKEKESYYPFLSADGNRIYFTYWDTVTSNGDIWMSERTIDGWNTPQFLPYPINTDFDDGSYTETFDGVIYLSSDRPGTMAGPYGNDNWCLRPITDSTYQVEHLSSSFNSSTMDGWPCIAPDESFLIFSSDRAGGIGGQDLFICFRKESNEWTSPVNMELIGAGINLPNEHPHSPSLSPDGKYLFYGRHNANPATECDIYWVSTHIIGGLRKYAFAPRLSRQIPAMNVNTDSVINYIIPENTFFCEYGNDSLKYTASLKNGSDLPAWLHFDPKTRTLWGTATQPEIDTVKITATNIDTVSATCTFRINVTYISSINQLEKENIIIFPNPTTGLVNVSFGNTLQNATIEIYNLQGTQVFLKAYKNTTSETIDLTCNASGIYVVKVIADGVSYEEKIIK